MAIIDALGQARDVSASALSIELQWTGTLTDEFEDYIANYTVNPDESQLSDTATPASQLNCPASWQLFSLCHTATLARLAGDFSEMLALEHVTGFTPLPHQVETARRVLQDLRGRAILADEVGLGKTIEAGLVIKEYQLRNLAKRILILVPASLVLQWTRELNEKFRIGAHAQKKTYAWTEYDVIVASLDAAKRDPHRTYVLDTDWDMLIVDEAHKLKNSKTKNWQLVNQISTKYMLLLTATPVQNNLQELHTLITLLKPGHLGNTVDFAAKHLETARTAKDPVELRNNVRHVMIRNRRRDGGVSLPDRHVHRVPITLNQAERTLYTAVQEFLRGEYNSRLENRGSMLPLMTLQREICSSTYAAMTTLERMLKKATNPNSIEALQNLMTLSEQVTQYTKVNEVLNMLGQFDGKCVIFTEYRATQDFLLYTLRKSGITAVPFRGGFGRGKKDWMKDLFENKARVLIATESGGEGINLQFCHYMINFDLPWNPMRLEQRIGRIHRLGQAHDVQVFHLATRDTIEEHIVALLQEKIRMFETVVGEVDHILDSHSAISKFEKHVFKVAMTSQSNEETKRRLETELTSYYEGTSVQEGDNVADRLT